MFEIVSPNKDIFTLTVETPAEKAKWIEAVNKQIGELLINSSTGYLGV